MISIVSHELTRLERGLDVRSAGGDVGDGDVEVVEEGCGICLVLVEMGRTAIRDSVGVAGGLKNSFGSHSCGVDEVD